MTRTYPEYHLQKQITQWLNLQHPSVLFDSDTIAAVKLTKAQAARNKAIQKAGFKRPDLVIYEPRGKWCGLFIELKASSPYKKDGTLRSDAHLEGQAATMEQLTAKGYYCTFAWEFEQVKKIIEDYLLG